MKSGWYWIRENDTEKWDLIAHYDEFHNFWIWDGLAYDDYDFKYCFEVYPVLIEPPEGV